MIISGGPSIKQYHVLNDKRHILTKDTDSHVALYDVLKAQRVEDLGQVDFEQETKNRGQVNLIYRQKSGSMVYKFPVLDKNVSLNLHYCS